MRQEFEVRAVLTDVDNTLVGNESMAMPSPRVTAAMREAALYVPTGVMTARTPKQATPFVEFLEMTGCSGMSNGAQIYDAKRKQMVVERVIDPAAVIQIAHELQKLGFPFWVQDDGRDYVIDQQGKDDTFKVYVPLDTYRPRKPFIIRWSTDQATAVATVEQFLQGFPQLISFPAHRYDDGRIAMFIADKKTNKADAVREIAEREGVDPKNILAIGDGPNDVPFMEACGTAVAMGNAVPEVKAKAHHVVSSWQNDGVAEAVDVFVLKKHQQR